MGGRREANEVIGRMVTLSFCAMFLVTGIADIASGVMKSDLGNAFIGIIFMAAGGIHCYGVLLKAIDEIRWLPVASRDSVSAAAPIR